MEGKGGRMGRLRTGRLKWGSRVALVLGLAIGVFLPGTGTASADQGSTTTPAKTSSIDEGTAAAKSSTATYQLPPERYQKAVSLARKEYTLYFVAVAWGILVLLALLQTGTVARLRDIAENTSTRRSIQALIFVPALMVLLAVLHLPISIYGHRLSLRYELSVQGWGSWMWDWTKGELCPGIALIVARLLLAVIRWKPRTWWLYFWMAAVPLALFLFFISPWFVDPLFNQFTPLQQKASGAGGVDREADEARGRADSDERMFLMEASAKTNALNAYVTGIGASKRVVIWDTTIAKTKSDELLVIVGHELGHYVLGHWQSGFAAYQRGCSWDCT